MNILIVDDEPLALEVLENYISRMQMLTLVGKCSNAIEAFEALHKHKVDLMFLDIEMPQIKGIDFLKTLSNPPKVVLTTAYPHYAIDGYELNVLDYLLKPVSFERFVRSVQKALPANPNHVLEDTTHLALVTEPKQDYIFVKADKKLIKTYFKDILFVEGLKDYVMIYTQAGRIITLQTMKSLEEKLPTDTFIRAHRSFIINIHKVDIIEANHLVIDKKEIPIGKNYKEELLEIINRKRL